ncbi:MAG: PIN domain-containing protein [Myxococcales bacterium]|nr:PIN domain-containing protein [Myxococcales bacterium]
MKRVLVDLNVVLDVLLEREPHVHDSAAVWRLLELGLARGLLSAHAITTLHFIAARARGPAFARRCISDVLSVFEVASVDGPVLLSALALGWTDFEDAVTATAAVSASCDALITRDATGFSQAALPVLSPRSALPLLA